MHEWRNSENAANTHLTPEARDLVLGLLNEGRIRGDRMNPHTLGEVRLRFQPRTVYINRGISAGTTMFATKSAFDLSPERLATLLAHEGRHTVQFGNMPFLERAKLGWQPDRIKAFEADAYSWSKAQTKP